MTDTCSICKDEPEYINFLGRPIGEKCWKKYESEKLKQKLGIERKENESFENAK